MAAVRWLVVHHTHAGPGRPNAESIAAYQTGPKAHLQFPEVAYHIFVEADGTVKWLQPYEALTWHAGEGSPAARLGIGSNNWESVAVCFSGEDPSAAQLRALGAVRARVRLDLGRTLAVRGHREVSVRNGQPLTECPGARYLEWLEQLR